MRSVESTAEGERRGRRRRRSRAVRPDRPPVIVPLSDLQSTAGGGGEGSRHRTRGGRDPDARSRFLDAQMTSPSSASRGSLNCIKQPILIYRLLTFCFVSATLRQPETAGSVDRARRSRKDAVFLHSSGRQAHPSRDAGARPIRSPEITSIVHPATTGNAICFPQHKCDRDPSPCVLLRDFPEEIRFCRRDHEPDPPHARVHTRSCSE